MSDTKPVSSFSDGSVTDTNSGNNDFTSSTQDPYDESNYPADAESESEDESLDGSEPTHSCNSLTDVSITCASKNEFLLKSRVQGEDLTENPLSDDILCAVCAEIFVQPCTLHCGHSFCQLCLAALWNSNRNKSPAYLHCPICRQPWVNFPGVNIQLRFDFSFMSPVAFNAM